MGLIINASNNKIEADFGVKKINNTDAMDYYSEGSEEGGIIVTFPKPPLPSYDLYIKWGVEFSDKDIYEEPFYICDDNFIYVENVVVEWDFYTSNLINKEGYLEIEKHPIFYKDPDNENKGYQVATIRAYYKIENNIFKAYKYTWYSDFFTERQILTDATWKTGLQYTVEDSTVNSNRVNIQGDLTVSGSLTVDEV